MAAYSSGMSIEPSPSASIERIQPIIWGFVNLVPVERTILDRCMCLSALVSYTLRRRFCRIISENILWWDRATNTSTVVTKNAKDRFSKLVALIEEKNFKTDELTRRTHHRSGNLSSPCQTPLEYLWFPENPMQQIMHYSSQHRHAYDISTSFSFACTNKSTMFARDDRAFSLVAVSLLGAISKFAFSFSKRMSIAILFSGLVRNAWILSFALFRSGRGYIIWIAGS